MNSTSLSSFSSVEDGKKSKSVVSIVRASCVGLKGTQYLKLTTRMLLKKVSRNSACKGAIFFVAVEKYAIHIISLLICSI